MFIENIFLCEKLQLRLFIVAICKNHKLCTFMVTLRRKTNYSLHIDIHGFVHVSCNFTFMCVVILHLVAFFISLANCDKRRTTLCCWLVLVHTVQCYTRTIHHVQNKIVDVMDDVLGNGYRELYMRQIVDARDAIFS